MRLHALTLYASAGALLLTHAPAAAAPRTYVVIVDKLKFGPIPSELHQGDILVWDNRDLFRHSATADDHHSFDVDLMAGAKKRMVLTKVGTFPFTCRYHPNMRGVLHVGK